MSIQFNYKKMRITLKHKFKSIALVILLLSAFATNMDAQQIRTSYFMKQSTMQINLNPSFRPETGYISVPVLGSIGAAYGSNGVSISDLLYPKDGKLVTFLDPSVEAGSFLDKLKESNQLNADFYTNILSTGWYVGSGFWTVDLALKTSVNTALPKSIFEFLKLGSGPNGTTYDISNIDIHANAYVELATGYSRPINDLLTVGGKVKFLFGGANMSAKFNQLNAELYDDQWKITSDGEMEMSMKGLYPEFKTDNLGGEYINSFNLKSPGLGGFGTAIDLGANYQPLENLTLSAAILDLGFIHWNGKNTVRGVANGSFIYDGFDLDMNDDGSVPPMDEQIDNLTDDLTNIFHFKQAKSNSRTTMLRSTINIGGEYSILDNQLGFGLLSSTQFYQPKAYTELTASANYHPLHWLTASVSYSFIHSDFKTLGMALNFTPSWINFFIGTDYIFTKVTPQFMPINVRAVNAYLGLSIPLNFN